MSTRSAGILLPIASLPGKYGIGDFGPEAFRFVDFLNMAGQHYWEILPLLIPDVYGSPFASHSALALNWLHVSPDLLLREGLLTKKELPLLPQDSDQYVRYQDVHRFKRHCLQLAWKNFSENGTTVQHKAFAAFCKKEQSWLDDYALFMTIQQRQHEKPWFHWPEELRSRKQGALKAIRMEHAPTLAYFAFEQWVAHTQWQDLRNYAHKKHIRIIGNIPFYVTHDSVDVWANRTFFAVNSDGTLNGKAGVPPDHFNKNGQLWGNPLYNWSVMARRHFSWMTERYRKAFATYDIIILDHFRGYRAFWRIPAKTNDPRLGKWQKVPAEQLFAHFKKTFRKFPVIVEDLGVITPDVHALRERLKLPGFHILQRSLQLRMDELPPHLDYPVRSVAFSGTYDMNTMRGWLQSTEQSVRNKVLRHMRVTPTTFAWEACKRVLHSASELCIIQLQDYLELGAEARINHPGTINRNWAWRASANMVTPKLARNIRALMQVTKRK